MSTNGHIEPRIVLTLLLGEKPNMGRKLTVARLLGEKGGRAYPFSVGYLENIVAGRQIPSRDGGMYLALAVVMEEVVTALLELIE